MPSIFISYRRDDAPANARLVYERLKEWFGEGNSFMDVEHIALGDDWKHVLSQRVTRCDALLAVIGPRWLTAANSNGRRRLDDPEDFVRWEIREALTRGKRVIPVLVDGAPLPRAADLPPDLAPLAGRPALARILKHQQPIPHPRPILRPNLHRAALDHGAPLIWTAWIGLAAHQSKGGQS
jgi:hypothetical protein